MHVHRHPSQQHKAVPAKVPAGRPYLLRQVAPFGLRRLPQRPQLSFPLAQLLRRLPPVPAPSGEGRPASRDGCRIFVRGTENGSKDKWLKGRMQGLCELSLQLLDLLAREHLPQGAVG
jgi:hypothetical protein